MHPDQLQKMLAKIRSIRPCSAPDCKVLELTGAKVGAMAHNPSGSEVNNYLQFEDFQMLQGTTDGMPESATFFQHLLSQPSESPSIVNSQDPEYSGSPLQFLNNNQAIPPQTSRSADQSNFYQAASPQNEAQYHYSQISNMYHASPTHPGMPSPNNMTPTSPKKSPTIGQGGERRFNFPNQPQQITYAQMPHATSTSPSLQALPETARFSGNYGFELSFGPPTPGATKSIDYTYSHHLRKLYVQRGAHCPFKFKSEKTPPEGSYIKVLPVYKGTHVLSESVKRCSNHAISEEESGNSDATSRYHFVRSDNPMASYEALDSGRLCVTFPFTGPQVGAEFQTELLSFQCFNSCGNSAHAKRRIDVIFTLEHQNRVLGRQVIEVRVCACPGRDRQNEEQNQSGGQRKRRSSQSVQVSSKRKRGGSSVETYTLTTPNLQVFEILLKVQALLEPNAESQSLEGQSHSPASNASSPQQARNQTVPESESEGD
ncbi:cellular tumor antigen p53-like isoform X1 [Rhopilema esculentum]|uniref:cellular tumor antigen p53-like isoform X1 n=1 Tax=Rhopilema esculentum TaxID=499914 RepID=UPI0031DB6D0D